MPDSVLASTVRPDTSRALGDSLRVEPDSLAIADSVQLPTFTLADYLDGLIERYPGSIEAARAQVLREALPRDPSTEPVEDHVEPEVASGAPHAPDEAAQPAPPEAPVAPPIDLDANPYGTFGVQPLNPAVGGFTRRTNGLADAVEASTLVRQLIEEGFRAAVATDGEDIFVVVGQYPTDKDLAIASAELPAAALGAGTDVVRLEDIELLPLVDGEDGQ